MVLPKQKNPPKTKAMVQQKVSNMHTLIVTPSEQKRRKTGETKKWAQQKVTDLLVLYLCFLKFYFVFFNNYYITDKCDYRRQGEELQHRQEEELRHRQEEELKL